MRIGVVGARRGTALVAALAPLPDVQVTALCDRDPVLLAKAADRLAIPSRYTQYEELLASDIDAVILATPLPLHVPQAVQALEAGKHVLSEVPAAADLTQCWELVQGVRRSRALYMLAENLNFAREVAIVGEMVSQGLFGEVYYGEAGYIHEVKALCEETSWRREWLLERNGCTYATHALGPLLAWSGSRVGLVSCLGSGHHYEDPHGRPYAMEDSVVMNCKLQSGGLLSVRVDMQSARPPITTYFALQGTRGCYESRRAAGERSRIWLADRSTGHSDWRDLEEFADEFLPLWWRELPTEISASGHSGADYQVARAFVESVRAGVSAVDVYRGLDMTVPGLVSQESIRRGGAPVPVPDFRALDAFPAGLPQEVRASGMMAQGARGH